MKKIGDPVKYQKHQESVERRTLRRRKRSKIYLKKYNVKQTDLLFYRRKIDDEILKRWKNPFHEYLKERGFHGVARKYIPISQTFSIEEDPENAILQLGEINAAIHEFMGETLVLDFSKCQHTDLHTLFILRLIANDYRARQYKLQQNIVSKEVMTKYKVINSKNQQVNKRLLAGGIIESLTTTVDQMMPISTLGIYTGERTRQHYLENRKGATATEIVRYVNNNLGNYNYKLTDRDRNEMESLICEILNNAEDHGLYSKWYATGTYFEESKKNEDPSQELIGELTITIVNFGQSFFEGFEMTKEKNKTTYCELEALYNLATNKTGGKHFTKENYFTLFSLQEGVSRLKFEESSRGTGTMKFINSFLSIGDYENRQKNYFPTLSILSGQTLLRCDNKHKTFQTENGDYCISLNSQKDLTFPPDKSHLKPLSIKFPGTVLAVKVYLNQKHLQNKAMQNATK